MNRVEVKTIKHVLIHLHEVYEHIGDYLDKKGVIESNVDILENAKSVLVNLHEKIDTEFTETGEQIHVEIKDYVVAKLDVIDDILALEMLVDEKKREYQQLLARSAREYAWIKENSEDVKIKNSYKKRTKIEIRESKDYLDHLLDLQKQKQIEFEKILNKYQTRNREILIKISNI